MPTVEEEIQRYLATGDSDIYAEAWPDGGGIVGREIAQHRDLRSALVAEVNKRAGGKAVGLSGGFDVTTFAAERLKPMVDGLFPEDERQAILKLLADSVVFLTTENIEEILRNKSWDGSTWQLANMYLVSLGLPGLDGEQFQIVGMSEGDKCYVTMAYFSEEDRFADFIVHEAAHIFHNWKRSYAGLPEKHRQEWLLPIEFRKREAFAYACEAYSRILALAKRPKDRLALVEEHAAGGRVSDERVEWEELLDILREAAAARNGWKRILKRCSPARQKVSHTG